MAVCDLVIKWAELVQCLNGYKLQENEIRSYLM